VKGNRYYVNRLCKLYDKADETAMDEGLKWYRNMYHWCETEGDANGLSVPTVAGVVAALSPVTTLSRNLSLAAEVCETGCGVGHPFSDKAVAIRNGADLTILGDRKTRAFADSIITKGLGNRVCFDSWAYRAMTGDMQPCRNGRIEHDKNAYRRWATTDYERAEEIYREAAAQCHRRPPNFQAITWCAVRGAHD